MEIEAAIEEITRILSAVYDHGFNDGETKQAIIELQARDKFLKWLEKEQEANLCNECIQIGRTDKHNYFCRKCGNQLSTKISP